MIMKRILIVFLFLMAGMAGFAQREQVGEVVTFHDTTWYDRGFDFYIGGGMFWGGKKSALYYNGSRQNECNLDYLFSNEYWRRDIQKKVVELYPHISMSDEIGYREEDLNLNPHYNLAACVSLGVRYKIRDNWGLSLSYTFARLTVTNKLLLTYNSVSGNNYDAPEMTLYGKEDRSMIDLSMSYLFSGAHRIVKPFVELGAQFNYARVKKFDAVIYGGPGFGFSFATGLKLVVNKYVSLDPTFYGSMSRINLQVYGEKPFTFNYGVMLRVVMNDFFFQNR